MFTPAVCLFGLAAYQKAYPRTLVANLPVNKPLKNNTNPALPEFIEEKDELRVDGLECSVIYQQNPNLLQDTQLAALAGVKVRPTNVVNSKSAGGGDAGGAGASKTQTQIKLDINNIPVYMCILQNKKVELASKASLTDGEKTQVSQIENTVDALQNLLNRLKTEKKSKTN